MDEGGWLTRDGRGAHGLQLWKDIRKEPTLLNDHSSVVVGNGRRVCVCKDNWCGSEPLCRTYPTLYSMLLPKVLWWQISGINMGRQGGGISVS